MRPHLARARIGKVGAAVGVTTLSVAGLVLNAQGVATADPKQASAFTGVGSDTTMEVLNGLAGFNNGINYTPVQSTAASGLRQLASWDAVGSDCITPKAGGATFLRPNGSTNGRRALSRSIDGGTWPASTTLCGGPKPVSGLVDFARSSSGPSGAGTALTYVPFARDALTWAYRVKGTATVPTSLTSAQLQQIYQGGVQNIGGTNFVGCLVQEGSGTRQSWISMVNAQIAAVEAGCGTTTAGGPEREIQEHDGNDFYNWASGVCPTTSGTANPCQVIPNNTVVIVGFSVSAWVAQHNGASPNRSGTALANGVDLGRIDALGAPYTGTIPNLAPSSTHYSSATYGRDVYNVFDTGKIKSAFGNSDLKSLFAGSTSTICSGAAQTNIVNRFGFLTPVNCGSTSLEGPLVS